MKTEDFGSKIIGKEITGIRTSNYEQGEADSLVITLDNGVRIEVQEQYIEGWCGFYLKID